MVMSNNVSRGEGSPIVLAELGLVEQRCAAVSQVINDAASVTDLAFRCGATRDTAH
jgi:hypothetical protein